MACCLNYYNKFNEKEKSKMTKTDEQKLKKKINNLSKILTTTKKKQKEN
jgi:hypothetical protein